jgi:CHASE3 domain sensor protein
MAAISLAVEGDKIQISFQKDDQTTAVVMDAGSARTLAAALSQLVAVMAEAGDIAADTVEGEIEDITSPTIDIGVDEEGQAILSLQAGAREPMLLRLQDDEARHVAESLLSILDSPRDVRQSRGGH